MDAPNTLKFPGARGGVVAELRDTFRLAGVDWLYVAACLTVGEAEARGLPYQVDPARPDLAVVVVMTHPETGEKFTPDHARRYGGTVSAAAARRGP